MPCQATPPPASGTLRTPPGPAAQSPPPPPAAPAPPAPARGAQKQSRGGPAARGGKYYARGGAKTSARDDLSGGGNPNQNGIDEAPQEKKFDGRGRGRGGSRGGPRGRGRQFDKHSQTGKVRVSTKAGVQRKATPNSRRRRLPPKMRAPRPLPAVNGQVTPTGGDWGAPAAPTDEWAAPADGAAPAATEGKPDREGRPPRREREPEEEDNTLTLEQYLAQQKEKESSVVPKLEGVRKANEGADADLWKGAVALEKPEEDAYFAGKVGFSWYHIILATDAAVLQTKAAPKARAKKEEKVFIEIDARFERPRGGGGRGRGGDDRRGRGGDDRRGRGGRGRDAPRGGGRPAGNNAPSFSVDDTTAFPSLS
ncbi:HABP4-PAI-RBP1 domain-containing protein [Mycena sanguinolenta]|uniref:HABP4-PAI-RBP1 domain-containing protein n=1 Tax=Mycena sanguinolenta TaxID=230812 RepID=A0A8H7CJ60_9AGAR|nr:HABP4-PAI-RBP1 domain-containing protein [Mycena sanguinolenta]